MSYLVTAATCQVLSSLDVASDYCGGQHGIYVHPCRKLHWEVLL